MSRTDRRGERQRAKSAKQRKLVVLLGIGFVAVIVYQFSAASGNADQHVPELHGEAVAMQESAEVKESVRQQTPSAALPRYDVTDLLRLNPFPEPEQEAVAVKPRTETPAAKETLSLQAVYGNRQRSQALLGNRVLAEGDLITPNIQVAEIEGRSIKLSERD